MLKNIKAGTVQKNKCLNFPESWNQFIRKIVLLRNQYEESRKLAIYFQSKLRIKSSPASLARKKGVSGGEPGQNVLVHPLKPLLSRTGRCGEEATCIVLNI